MTDEATLATIACEQTDRSIRLAAANKVGRPDLIERIIGLCPDLTPRLRRAVPRPDDLDRLANVQEPTLDGKALDMRKLSGVGLTVKPGPHTFRAGYFVSLYGLDHLSAPPVSAEFVPEFGDVCVLRALPIPVTWAPSVECQRAKE
jgi:hypothetical protein